MSRTLKQTRFYTLAKELLELTKKMEYKSKCIDVKAYNKNDYDKCANNLKILVTNGERLSLLLALLDSIVSNIEAEDAIINNIVSLDDKILVKDSYDSEYQPAYLFDIKNGYFAVFTKGRTSWTANGCISSFNYAKLVKEACNDNI